MKKRQLNPSHVNLSHARTKEQRALMEKSLAEEVCIFCEKHLKRFHEPPILKKGKHWIVTPNMYPYEGSRIHTLFITRTHIEHLSELSTAAWKELTLLFKWAIKHHKIKGGSVFIRFGDSEQSCATISHLHAHLIDGGKRIKNGRKNKPVKAWVAYHI